MAAVEPYPYELLRKIPRSEVDVRRRCIRTLPDLEVSAFLSAAESVLGEKVKLDAEQFQYCAFQSLHQAVADPLVAIILVPPSGPIWGRLAIELDPVFAMHIVDRALGGDGSKVPATLINAIDETSQGVLTYVAAQVLAQTTQQPWRVVSVVTSAASLAGAIQDQGSIVWPATLSLNGISGKARAWIPVMTAQSFSASYQPVPRWIEKLPIEVVVDIGRATIAASDLVDAQPGDALTLDEIWWDPKNEELRQARATILAGSRLRLWCKQAVNGLEVVEVDVSNDMSQTKGAPVPSDESGDPSEALADAPVELSVEIARFRLSVQELAAIRPGEVLISGKRIGEHVTLRAGDRAVAEGELVNVDGEVAVRLSKIGA